MRVYTVVFPAELFSVDRATFLGGLMGRLAETDYRGLLHKVGSRAGDAIEEIDQDLQEHRQQLVGIPSIGATPLQNSCGGCMLFAGAERVVPMKQKRDFSMLIGVLAGPPAMLLFFVFLFIVIGLTGKEDSLPRISVPDGSEMTETDSHGGFHGEGVRVVTARISKEAVDEFAQQLRDKGFAEPPTPQWLQKELRADVETGLAGNITRGLWRFQADSSQPIRENVENYTAELYDFDTYLYYYIEYDT